MLRAARYVLDLALEPADRGPASTGIYGGGLTVDLDLTIENAGDATTTTFNFLLHRLLHVEAAKEDLVGDLGFRQHVRTLEGHPAVQVNAVQVELPEALEPGQESTIHLSYSGAMCGYPELDRSWDDRVSWEYTLLRAEALWYPLPAPPTWEGYEGSLAYTRARPFTFRVSAVAPDGLSLAVGGERVRVDSGGDGIEVSEWESFGETSRIDVAAAPFRVESTAYLITPGLRPPEWLAPPSGTGAAHEFLVDWLGAPTAPLRPPKRPVLVEVPPGRGVEGNGYAFRERDRLHHPLAQPPEPRDGSQATRAWALPSLSAPGFFAVSLPLFLAAVATRAHEGPDAWESRLARARAAFVKAGPAALAMPVTRADRAAGAVKEAVLQGKGVWALAVLEAVMGEEAFREGLAEFHRAARDGDASLDGFRATLERIFEWDLSAVFAEWLEGTQASRHLVDGQNLDAIARRYD